MSFSLVHLHIPKSAGTSHRAYLAKIFGEDQIFWFGLQSDAARFDAKQVGASYLLGGHRPLSFYPRAFNALYTSVVRNPVERAVSFFHYCTEAPISNSSAWLEEREIAQQEWRRLGIDPSSLSRSIESCEAFRREISNLQCRYLSRYEPTFEGVLKTLEEENMVIGVFDEISIFNTFLQEELDFPIENKVRTNVGREGYSSKAFSERGLANLIRSINVEDQLLYDFLRYEHGGLYMGADNISSVRDMLAPATFDWSNVQLFGKGTVKADSGGQLVTPLVINNLTTKPLSFTKHSDEPRSIGWQVLDKMGVQIENFCGTVKLDQSIPAEKPNVVQVSLNLNKEILNHEASYWIEFSIVNGGDWLNQKYPLNSAWLCLVRE